MNEPENESDPLRDLLLSADDSARYGAEPQQQLAERVWNIHRVRSNRLARLKISAALIGCYVAGLVTMKLVIGSGPHDIAARPTTDRVQSPSALTTEIVPGVKKESLQLEDTTSNAVAAELTTSVGDEETGATVADQQQTAYARYCALGDEYLKHGRGIEAAAECYGLALDRATDDERRVVGQTDSWLLTALKTERREET